MVEEKLELEPEVVAIFNHISQGENFLLSGGAGSGKTYSLVQVIREAIRLNPTAKVACMTFTNAAVKEIEHRVDHPNLNVTTIHDFLWDQIKSFQRELKSAVIELINNEEETELNSVDAPLASDYFDGLENGIQYKEWLSIKDGIISHDELIVLASYMYGKYPKLSDILKDKFQFIFIDEYQDTHEKVIAIFLEHLKKSKRKNIIGFFGDAMQAIYDDGIGDLNDYKGDDKGLVKEVKKSQNRRSPLSVINLANRLRTDGITQIPSTDDHAPNMVAGKVKEGAILFLHSKDSDVNKVKDFLTKECHWDTVNAKRTKELNLTHNLIADKAGFRILMDIYDGDGILNYRDRIKKYIKDRNIVTDFSEMNFGQVVGILSEGKTGRELNAVLPTNAMKAFIDEHFALYNEALAINYPEFLKVYVHKDQLLDDKKQDEKDENKKGSKRDNLIRHLYKIQTIISLYINEQYNEFLKVTDYRVRIKRIADKKALKESIESLIHVGDKTIETVLTEAHEKGICLIDDKLLAFQEKQRYLYNRVKEVPFSEFQKLFDYLEGKTPFSTQHKTKGSEFDDVLVILDNGRWNNYNFENLFTNSGTPSVLERTQKIFYVCCTRARENLAVFFHNPSEDILNKAKEWFGKDNVIELTVRD